MDDQRPPPPSDRAGTDALIEPAGERPRTDLVVVHGSDGPVSCSAHQIPLDGVGREERADDRLVVPASDADRARAWERRHEPQGPRSVGRERDRHRGLDVPVRILHRPGRTEPRVSVGEHLVPAVPPDRDVDAARRDPERRRGVLPGRIEDHDLEPGAGRGLARHPVHPGDDHRLLAPADHREVHGPAALLDERRDLLLRYHPCLGRETGVGRRQRRLVLRARRGDEGRRRDHRDRRVPPRVPHPRIMPPTGCSTHPSASPGGGK